MKEEIIYPLFSEIDRNKCLHLLKKCDLGVTMILRPKKASDELTSRLHCAIRCVANQIEWAGDKLSEEEWKLLFVAALFGQRVVASPNGSGFVVLQKKTRNMSGDEKFDLLEYVYSFGSVRGVTFDEN